MKKKPIRITVDLTPFVYGRVEALEKHLGAASKAEVVRRALAMYEFLSSQVKQGASLQLAKEDGSVMLLVFPEMF